MHCGKGLDSTREVLGSVHTPGRGVLAVYVTGRSNLFFGLKIYTLSILLGQEICHVFV